MAWLPRSLASCTKVVVRSIPVGAKCGITTRQVENTVAPDAFVAALRADGPVASWAREVSVAKGCLLGSGE